jgi:hypothetical protein
VKEERKAAANLPREIIRKWKSKSESPLESKHWKLACPVSGAAHPSPASSSSLNVFGDGEFVDATSSLGCVNCGMARLCHSLLGSVQRNPRLRPNKILRKAFTHFADANLQLQVVQRSMHAAAHECWSCNAISNLE